MFWFNVLYLILSTKFYFRSDLNATIEGVVLEVMFEFSTDAYVYKFWDLALNSIEYISIEELTSCDWRVRDSVPTPITTLAAGMQNKTKQSIIVSKQATMNDTITTTVPAIKRKGGGSFDVVLGPTVCIFDAVILEDGLKRNRKKWNRYIR